MKYLFLLGMSPDSAHSPEAPATQDWGAYTTALAEAGILVGGEGLQGVETATTVRVRDGERLLTDGPFVETKEHLVGYYLVDVDDLDTALDWAAKVPNVRIGSVEVRPLLSDSDAQETVAATSGASAG